MGIEKTLVFLVAILAFSNANTLQISKFSWMTYLKSTIIRGKSLLLYYHLKPNYFNKQRFCHHFYLHEVDIQVQMAMKPQQASPMYKMDGTRLPSTPLPFWTCISTSGKKK